MSPKKGKPLLDYYVTKYEEVEGHRPVMNRTKRVWGFADMYEDMGENAYRIIDFFFSNYENGYHEVDRLMYNYDTMFNEMNEAAEEHDRRIRIAKETAERVKNGE